MQTRLITDYLDRSARLFPDKTAFDDSGRSVTFSAFRTEARYIAAKIISLRIFKAPIAVFLDKGVSCLSAMFASLYSGNFYTVLDTQMPLERIAKIFGTLKPRVVLTDTPHKPMLDSIIRDEAVVLTDYEAGDTGTDGSIIDECVDRIIDTDVAYVLFTSGSTGIPKGVIVPHKSVISYTEWGSKAFGIDETTILGNQTPFYFSMSVFDIFQTVRNACTMHIIPKTLFTFPVKLLEYLAEHNVNTIYWVPSALCLCADLKALGKRDISCLKKILFAGEVMPTKQLNMWRELLPDAMYANLFGPTEVTDICNYYVVNRKLSNDEPVPIGNACNNCDVLILNDEDKAAGLHEQGELCVRGSFVAYGYYNNPDKTAEVFVQNPLNPYYREIIYRTGDLVKYNSHGELVYLGRKDFQIKHMGHRIELGEIETAVSSVDGVERTACLYDTQKNKIVVFYTGKIDSQNILNSIKTLIPDYMIPQRCIRLDKMPVNLNGKIDRVFLKSQL